MRRVRTRFWFVLALALCPARSGVTQESGDPFLTSPDELRAMAVSAQYETSGEPAAQRVQTVSGWESADSADRPQELFAPGDNPSRVATSHPNLFPNGPPPATEGEWIYPDGTTPVQYPLDDDAYRGLPEAYPGNQPPPTFAPPIVPPPGGGYIGPEPGLAPVSWKSAKASLTHVFGQGDTFGIGTFDIRGTLQFADAPGFFLTPQFGWHLLSGPSSTDMPPQLYDLSLDFGLYRPVGDAWLLNFSLTPSLFTDGDNWTSDAFRILGRFMAYYTSSPSLQWAGGIIYLDREDVPVLPAFGVIMTPRDDLRYELMFPKPRLAWRQYFNAAWEQWVYVTGELGGQSWGIERASGADDIASYRDLRFILGMERKLTDGRTWYVEGGYVFNREIEYDSNIGGLSLSDTGFLRVGGSF